MTSAPYLEKNVTVGDIKLHYQEWGDPSKPTVLMVHGFGVSGHMFDEFGDRAKDRYHLVALDQRGHGDSDWSADGDYSRAAFVSDIEGFRQALGLESFLLVGHSMGGLNAVAYTAEYPQYVRGLVLVDVGPEAAKEGVDNIVRFTSGPDELEFDEFVEAAHRFNPRRSLDNIRERMRHRLKPTESGKWTWKFDKRFRSDREALRIGSELSSDEMWALFRSVSVPTLIVRGSQSDVLTQEVAERTVTEMPRARLEVVPEAGHSVPGDNPDDFTAVVTRFFDDVASHTFQPDTGARSAPIERLVRVNESMRRRPGIGSAIMLAAGAALAVAGIGWAVKRKRDNDRKAAARKRREQLHLPSNVDLDAVQLRMSNLASELAEIGRQGVDKARAAANDPQVQAAVAQARAKAEEAGHRSLEAIQSIDTNALRERGKTAASKASRLAPRSKARKKKGIMGRLPSWP